MSEMLTMLGIVLLCGAAFAGYWWSENRRVPWKTRRAQHRKIRRLTRSEPHSPLAALLRSYTLVFFGVGAWYMWTSSDHRIISPPLATILSIAFFIGFLWQGKIIALGLYDYYARTDLRLRLDSVEEIQVWGGTESGFLESVYLLTMSDETQGTHEFLIDEAIKRRVYPRVGEGYIVEVARRTNYLFNIRQD